ncbi:hypothetical protein G7Y89_g10753 [Cudoniella acicularis]|uniref:magnesium chelatase n=1 Tax=Cudoniella acicularis TaxID=354080 RepID=A0A8H4VYQ0_9HELO|nr:hypothetical protein G7Y89_g10753 [Cudoniella acicularis]
MADETLINKIHELSDLELAALICLVAKEHCIIDTEPVVIDELVQELELVFSNLSFASPVSSLTLEQIAAKVFGLSYAVVDCSEHTSLDDFAHAILTVEGSPTRSNSPVRTRQDSYFLNTPAFQSISRSPVSETFADNKTIPNVIIAKNLDEAPKQVQIQALELMRTKRIYTRTSVQNAPKRFLFIALLAGGDGPRLTKHLNDHMFISHFHDPEDGFPNLEEMFDDTGSISSVVKKSPRLNTEFMTSPRVSATEIEQLVQLSEQATVSIEVKAYQQNIIAFLRVHRAVASGISAPATVLFDKLAKCLAPLHNLSYATPSLIDLAARKIYPHRIQIVKPENERSMQWGSDLDAVAELLEGTTTEDVIEDVLGSSGAETPL